MIERTGQSDQGALPGIPRLRFARVAVLEVTGGRDDFDVVSDLLSGGVVGNLRLEIEAEIYLACRRLGASWDILPKIRIGRGLYKACQDLGADAQLLAIIDSYCNTLSDATCGHP